MAAGTSSARVPMAACLVLPVGDSVQRVPWPPGAVHGALYDTLPEPQAMALASSSCHPIASIAPSFTR